MRKNKKIKLLTLMNTYISHNSIERLASRTGLGLPVLEKILCQPWSNFRFSTLNTLYLFFRLERDEYFEHHLRKWTPMTKSISGSLIRAKRIKRRLTLSEFAKLAGCNERTVRRVESGDSHYLYATSTFARILESLELSSREKKVFGTFLTIAGKFSQVDRKKMFGFSSCL